MCRQSATVCLVKSVALPDCSGLSLAQQLVRLPDPRHRRGVRHPFVAVLLIAACVVVAGALSYTAVAQWARNASQETLARLGARLLTSLNVRIAPSRSTIRRVVTAVCPGGRADLTGVTPLGLRRRRWTARAPVAPAAGRCRPHICSPPCPATAAVRRVPETVAKSLRTPPIGEEGSRSLREEESTGIGLLTVHKEFRHVAVQKRTTEPEPLTTWCATEVEVCRSGWLAGDYLIAVRSETRLAMARWVSS
ncbi:transposase family protein [Streptomyces noursei]|uniref:transposase family protein n=1 Tax=Streptomyces noursei TaxID=1971 RepID=UPI000C9CD316|nr:transposase family protein [Streptomyces noursei]